MATASYDAGRLIRTVEVARTDWAAMAGGLMKGGITARQLDYFALLVGASIVALFSGVVATLCIKFEERGPAWFWAALFFGSALVAAYCLVKLL